MPVCPQCQSSRIGSRSLGRDYARRHRWCCQWCCRCNARRAPWCHGLFGRWSRRLRQHHKLADLLQVAGLARSTFYYQCQAAQCADQQSAIEARIRTVYDEHKGRYGYPR